MVDERPPKLPEYLNTAAKQIKWAQAYHTGTTIIHAAPPGKVWTNKEWHHALNIVSHEAAHNWLYFHDRMYDGDFPFWKQSRDGWGQ